MNDLQSLAEQLFNEINNKLEIIKDLERRERLLSISQEQASAKSRRLLEFEERMTARVHEINKEQDAVTLKIGELKKKEDIAAKLIKQGEEIKKQQEELDEKRKKLGLKEFQLKEFELKLEQEKKELERRESIIVKQSVLDTERKAALDRAEESIRKERERLERIASEYNT